MFDKSYISDIFSNEIYTNKVQVVRKALDNKSLEL